MKKYKYRNYKKLAKAINIAYLTTAILCGVAGCICSIERNELKQEFLSDKISHEQFLEISSNFSEKEENIFKILAGGFAVTFVSDIACGIASKGKDF